MLYSVITVLVWYEALKQQVAKAAMAYIPEGEVVGVGTGSTVDYFIDCLAEKVSDIPAVVASSEQASTGLRNMGSMCCRQHPLIVSLFMWTVQMKSMQEATVLKGVAVH